MIKVNVFYNDNRDVCGLEVYNHGDSIVCAGVSALALNAINSIERFTDEKFTCEYNEKGGLLKVALPAIQEGKRNHDAALLLDSLVLGLYNIAEQYGESIRIKEVGGKAGFRDAKRPDFVPLSQK